MKLKFNMLSIKYGKFLSKWILKFMGVNEY